MGHVIIMGGGRATVPVTYDPVFANNSWAQIIDACKKRKVPSTWNVADQKAMLINGTEYLIDIIGKNHDDYSDGSGKAPLTFQFHDCYNTTYNLGSDWNWSKCDNKLVYLPAILALMPSEVQNGIKNINKLTGETSAGATILQTSENKLFLLAEREIFVSGLYSIDGEGTLYEYYSGDIASNRIKQANNVNSEWWLRSVNADDSGGTCYVTAAGGPSWSNRTNRYYYLAPAFCF